MANYLYNGMPLPNIDTVWTDKEVFWNAVIAEEVLSGNTILILLNDENPVGSYENPLGDNNIIFGNGSDDKQFCLASDGLSWVEDGLTSGCPKWSNYDIYNEDGTLYLAASEPVPLDATSHITKSSGNGYALYNGVKLPNIESVWTDKVKYPYAYLVWSDQSTIESGAYLAALYVSKTQVAIGAVTDGKMHFSDGYGVGMITNSQVIVDMWAEYGIIIGVNAWEFQYTTGIWEEPPNLPIWSNRNTLNTDGSTYLTASDPIHLDGMTVIEWDGDTEGLVSVPLGSNQAMYRVADFEPANNAVSVVFNITANEFEVDTSFSQEENGTWGASGICAVAIPETIDGVTPGIYFWNVFGGDNDLMYTSLLAYTPAAAEDDTTDNSINPTSMLMGWLVGRAVASQRGKVTPSEPDVPVVPDEPEKQLIGYSYNGVVLPDINEVWTDKEKYPYCFIGVLNEWYVFGFAPVPLNVFNNEISGATEATASAFFGVPSDFALPLYISNGTEWTYADSFGATDNVIYVPSKLPIWANHDVINTENDTTYLAASDPIPVYE